MILFGILIFPKNKKKENKFQSLGLVLSKLSSSSLINSIPMRYLLQKKQDFFINDLLEDEMIFRQNRDPNKRATFYFDEFLA